MNPTADNPAAQTVPGFLRGALGNRRRRFVAGLICVLAVATLLLGIQSWRVISAIVEVERAAVVPLPPSEAVLPTATAESRTIAGLNPVTSGNPLAMDPAPDEVNSPSDFDRATPEGSPHAETGESISRLDVARQLVDAGIGGGKPGSSEIWDGKDSLNILVLGVDRRPAGGDQNADVIIIAHLDLLREHLSAVSLPRDLLVEIPGIGPDKINGAYNYGVLQAPEDPVAGVAKVRDTIESAYGIQIDGYVLIDFAGFSDVIDAVGGIEVDVPYEIVDSEYPTENYGVETIRFEPGPQTLDGEHALKYVRTRHADSDDARRERQLDVIRSVFAQGKSFTSITNADEIILAAGEAIQTSFDLDEQLTLARIAYAMQPEDIRLTTLTEPLLESGWTDTDRWVYTGDPAEIRQFIVESIRTD